MENFIEGLKITGQVNIVKTNSDGVVVEEHNVKNLVVSTGKTFIAAKMIATTNSPAAMTHMGIGTNNTAVTSTDTSLLGQTARQSLSGATSSGAAITFTATFPAGTGDGAITEAGIFNASTSGTMLCRTVFPTVNKGSGDQITITWVITVS